MSVTPFHSVLLRFLSLTVAGLGVLGETASAQLGTPLASARLLNRNGTTDATGDGPVSIASTVNGFLTACWSTSDAGLGLGGDPDIVYAVSRDDGATWTAPGTFSIAFSTDGTKDDADVRLAANTAHYMAVWASNRTAASGAHGIYSAYGSVDGLSWVNAAQVDVALASDAIEDRRPAIASSGSTWIVAWERFTTPTDHDIWFSRTTSNGGPTWSVGVPLQTNAATDSGSDTDPRLASDGAGRWICVWSSDDTLGGTLGSDVDVLYSTSIDDGLTWSAPAAMNPDAATDGNARDVRPVVAYDATTGTWIVVWASDVGQGGPTGDDFELYAVRSTNGGVTWSAKGLVNTDAATDSSTLGNDLDAEIASDRNGHFLVTWNRPDPSSADMDVVAARSDDAGATWTAPVALVANAAVDTADDRRPVVAVTAQGHAVYAWASNDTLGGTIGDDGDLLFTRNMIAKADLGVNFCFGAVETGLPSACPCNNDASIIAYSGCLNSTGVGASLGLTGTTSVSLPSVIVAAGGLVPGGPVLFFEGVNAVNQGYGTSFGDGLRCVGGSVRRLAVATSGPTGNAGITVSTAGQVPGTTRYYQGWYRDTGAVCAAGFFNLTSAQVRAWVP